MEIAHFPWSYQNESRWFYVVPTGETGAWAWSPEYGWRFSAASVYPWIYDTDEGWFKDSN